VITPADLLAPIGPVEVTLFPGEYSESSGATATKLESRLQTYIDQAYAKIDGIAFPLPDTAARAWALHLTFAAAYVLACSRPANENMMVAVLGSKGFAKDQRDALLVLSEQYAGEFAVLEAEIPVSVPIMGSAQSRQITNIFEW
jgi:hypothetical protein